MAREKDAEKRQAILSEAKRLFAERGFHATSVADIVRGIEIPVGSVYTYFRTKDEIIETIIEEGWAQFRDSLMGALKGAKTPEERLGMVINTFLPELFADADFISLFLTEALGLGGLSDKLSFMANVIAGIITDVSVAKGQALPMGERDVLAGLMIFFLGSMDSVRLMRAAKLPVTEADIVAFIRTTVRNAFGIEVPAR
jgi:AcrR family transcriptional regulator